MEQRLNSSQQAITLKRREILKMVAAAGGLAVLSSFLEACDRARSILTPGIETESIYPSATRLPNSDFKVTEQNMVSEPPQEVLSTSNPEAISESAVVSQVAFIKTKNRQEGIRQAIDLLGINPAAGKKVFIKPNFNSADPTPGSTHLDVLASLVLKLQEMGANKIIVGDRSGMGDTRQVMWDLGIFDLAEKLGFELVIFDNLVEEDWVMFQPDGSHWKSGFPFARPCLEADTVVQTCCLKTHRYGGQFTLSLKNSVGLVAKKIPAHSYNYMNELHSSPDQRRMIAEINTAYSPGLIILDGVEAFISGGPDNGGKADSQVILAGTDRIAVDAVGVALLRFHGCKTEVAHGKIFEQEQIARAVELGLGVDSPEKIQLLTSDGESAAYADQIYNLLLGG